MFTLDNLPVFVTNQSILYFVASSWGVAVLALTIVIWNFRRRPGRYILQALACVIIFFVIEAFLLARFQLHKFDYIQINYNSTRASLVANATLIIWSIVLFFANLHDLHLFHELRIKLQRVDKMEEEEIKRRLNNE